MASNTTTSTLQFKSYKGGERRSTDGAYRVRKLDDSTWVAERRNVQEHGGRTMGASAWEALGSGETSGQAEMVAEQIATNPALPGTAARPSENPDNFDVANGEPPSFVQQGASDETVADVLASIPDPEVEDVRRLVAQTDAAAKTVAKVAAKADSAAKRGAKAAATKAANANLAPVELVFAPHRGDEDDKRAKGSKRTFRVQRGQAGGYYAAQRGTGGWTPIAGKCHTEAEALDLCTRYEGGAAQLSHRDYQGMPYAQAVAKLDGK